MSDIQPMGALLTFNGEERRLFWDYGVIEKVQDLYGGHPFTAIQKILWEEKLEDGTMMRHYQAKPVLDLTYILLNNEISREKYFDGKSDKKKYTREELGILIDRNNANKIVAALIASWRDSVLSDDAEENEEDDEKNAMSE